MVVNGVGAVLTAVVLVVVTVEKFAAGAWLVVILVPTLVAMMLFIQPSVLALRQGALDPRRTWS